MSYADKEKHNAYHRDYQKRRYHKRRSEALQRLGNKCAVCGSQEEMEIDHIDFTNKSFSVSRLWGVTESKFWDEIKKCQILCKFHHQEKTIGEIAIRRPLTHGKYWAAYKHRCKCDLCEQYKKDANLKRRQARVSNSNG